MRKSIKWRLIKLALIILPIIVFYFWSYIGLGILSLIGMIFLYITRKMDPQIQNNTDDSDDDDSSLFDSVSIDLKHTWSPMNLHHKNED